MANSTDDVITHLNDLARVCVDGIHGYRTAATDIKNSELATVFEGYAAQRAKFLQQLEGEVKRLGGVPNESGSLSASVHRGWMNLKAAVTGSSAEAIVAACETGEDSATAAFERVVDTILPGEVRSLVEHQWEQIKEAHSHMKRLKEQAQRGVSFVRNE